MQNYASPTDTSITDVHQRHRSSATRPSEFDEVRFELPRPGQLRVRQLVNRGAPRPVSKFHSLKLRRVVHCESSLEVDVAKLLDACPGMTFAEQPLVLHYFMDGLLRRHIPDFMFQARACRGFIEVKFESDIDDEVRKRTSRLIELLAPYGWRYRVLTESTVRSGHLLSNVQALLRRGRQRPPEYWSLATFDRIGRNGPVPLGAFGWAQAGQMETAWISHELLVGNLYADLTVKLNADTHVHIPHSDMGGVLPWLLEHSK